MKLKLKIYSKLKVLHTVEPRLSNSYLSIPLIIQNECPEILKQVIPNCWARDSPFAVNKRV